MNRIITSWDSYTWQEKIFLLKHILKTPTLEALSKKLGISYRTLLNWRTGSHKPNKACEEMLKKIYEDYTLDTIRTNDVPVTADFVAETSYDSMQSTIHRYLSEGNSMQAHCILFAIASKLATDCLAAANSATIIPRISCIYGSDPATIKLTIEDASVPNQLFTLKLTHTAETPRTVLVFITMTKNNVLTRELGLVLGAEASSVITNLVTKFFYSK
jgi:hypothetical protein